MNAPADNPGNTAEAESGLPLPRRWFAIMAISFGTALFVVDGAIPTVALPTIARELGVSSSLVTNVVTVYQLVLVMLLLPLASLGDRIGHRTQYQWGQVIFMVSSALCLFVDSFVVLLLLRTLQAIGAGMALCVSSAMLRQIYPMKNLGTAMGLNSVIVASSAALAPTLGGYIVEHLPWQFVFVAAAPFAVVSLLLGRALPDPQPREEKTDWLAGGWSALTMLLLIGAMQIGTHGGLLLGLALGALGIVLLVGLVRRERTRINPVLPVDLMAKPVLGLSALAAMTAFIATATLMLSLPFRLEDGLGYPPGEVGLMLLPFPLTMLFVAPLAGYLSDRISPTKLGVPGLGLAIVGLLLMATMPAESGPAAIAWRLSLTAAGFGLFYAPNTRLLIGSAPRERAAAAGGMLSTSRLLGQAMAAVVVGMLLAGQFGMGPVPLFVSCGFAVVAAGCSLVRYRYRPGEGQAG